MTLTRRDVLLATGGAALSGCVGPAPGPFPLGVAAGDVTAEGAVLWTKHAAGGPLVLRVWNEDQQPEDARAIEVTPADGFARVLCDGLPAATWHRFSFEGEGGVSQPGRFRTALAPDSLEPLTFGATSCIHWNHPHDALAHAAARTDLDAFIFLGDAVYNDGAEHLEAFRQKWALGLDSDAYRALRASTSLVAIWDDHEVTNNWQGDAVRARVLAAARDAWLEHQPARVGEHLWRSLRWGRTAELFVLDGRAERDARRGHYISPEQLRWLVDGVRGSDATFKILVNTVPIGAFDFPFFAPFNQDHWLAYPEQRRALLEGIEGTPGLLVVSGDFHLGSFGRVAARGPGASVFEVLAGPGANAPNPCPSYPSGDPWEFSTARRNYVTLALDPHARTATVRHHSAEGTLFERVVEA